MDRFNYWKAFMDYVFSRFGKDKCSSVAAELTVTSLLALVPLTTVVFSLLALIPSFQTMAAQLQSLLFEYFVPSTGESVQNYLLEFVGKAKGMSGIGFLMLLITALLMMKTIDTSFNHIWQIKSRKSVVRTFLVYWAILTLGPILLGTSLVLTSYLKSLPLISNVVEQNSAWMTLGLPMLMETIAFALMFFIIPNRKILPKHAIVAAMVTALLFEFAKSGFAIFVEYFSTYQLIFGALATIPLFLIWIYLSWSIILFGAQVCHGLFAFEVNQKRNAEQPMIQLLKIILLLVEKQSEGHTIAEHQLISSGDWGSKEASILWLEKLEEAGIVAKLQDQDYCLKVNSCDIDYLALYQVAGKSLPDVRMVADSNLPNELKQKLNELSSNMDVLLQQKVVSDLPAG